MITLEEPELWRVVMLFDGEVLGESTPYKSPVAAEKRRAELLRTHPRHQVVLLRGVTTWTEVS